MTTTTYEAPKGMHSVTPHLVCAGAAKAIEFYKKAFDAQELMRLEAPNGKIMHACIRIGDSALMLVDEMEECNTSSPKTLKGTPVTLHLYVKNCDDAIKKAAAAGATIVMPAEDMFWGDRYGVVEDPFGHRWSMAHQVRDMTLDEIQEAAKEMTC